MKNAESDKLVPFLKWKVKNYHPNDLHFYKDSLHELIRRLLQNVHVDC